MASARPARTVRLSIALSASLLFAVLAVALVRADTQSRLKAAESRVRALIARIATEEQTVRALQAQATVLAQAVDQVQTEMALTQGRIVDLETRIRVATNRIAATQSTLDYRAWVAYENGPGSSLEFLLGSTSLADLTDRLEIVNHVARSDADLIAQIADQRTLLQDNQTTLQQQENRLQAQKAQLSAQETALNAKLASAQGVVDQLNA